MLSREPPGPRAPLLTMKKDAVRRYRHPHDILMTREPSAAGTLRTPRLSIGIRANVRANWKERTPRETLTGVQWH